MGFGEATERVDLLVGFLGPIGRGAFAGLWRVVGPLGRLALMIGLVEPDALVSLGDEGTDILVAIVDVVEASGVAYASRACRGKKEK